MSHIDIWHPEGFVREPKLVVKVLVDEGISEEDNLERAFRKTNINEEDMEKSWYDNEGVIVPDPVRSTSVGDLMVINRNVYAVAGSGFIHLNSNETKHIADKTSK
jgi:hypothetical protein